MTYKSINNQDFLNRTVYLIFLKYYWGNGNRLKANNGRICHNVNTILTNDRDI